MAHAREPNIAVLIPCRNEAQTVGAVVGAFREALPLATFYVFDNSSTDDSADTARMAGAVVRSVDTPGKGRVVRRMFADTEADVYLLVDGDGTYDASSAGAMVGLILDGHDLVNAARQPVDGGAFATGHVIGNRVLSGLVLSIFGSRINDTLSGYKALSRRFVKSFPVSSNGFEIETEMTVHALELAMPVAEVRSPYRSRPSGSTSKLSARRDGLRILRTIFGLIRQERPLSFFLLIAAILASISLALAIPLLLTYLKAHQVPRLPTAILATGMMILAFLSATAGVVLDTVTRGRREAKMLAYLALDPPSTLATRYPEPRLRGTPLRPAPQRPGDDLDHAHDAQPTNHAVQSPATRSADQHPSIPSSTA